MQTIVILTLVSVTLSDYLVKLLGLPSVVRFLPEALSALIMIYVLFAGTRERFRLVAPKYWFVLGALLLIVICGIIDNDSSVGQVLSGARYYLRPLPMFFLPAVLALTEEQVKRQCKWVLGLALLQVPVAIYQQWVIQSEGRFTGDDVKGTLMDSGILSLFLLCVMLVLTSLVLKHRLRPRWYWVLMLVLFIPTTINETKVTIFFLPIGMLITLWVAADRGKKLKYLSVCMVGLLAAAALYVPIYNFTQRHNPYKNEKDITTFFTNDKALGRYLSSNVGGVGTAKDVRRGDAVIVPLQYLAQDPVHLAFGLGIGAVAPSQFGKNFEGAYYQLFLKFLIISFTVFLLEFGVFGMLAIAALYWMVFWDTLKVARRDTSFTGVLAAGWVGVVVLFAIDVGYNVFHQFPSVTYLYCYFSGLMCARCVSLAYEARVKARKSGERGHIREFTDARQRA